jgi:hypothetical protein
MKFLSWPVLVLESRAAMMDFTIPSAQGFSILRVVLDHGRAEAEVCGDNAAQVLLLELMQIQFAVKEYSLVLGE